MLILKFLDMDEIKNWVLTSLRLIFARICKLIYELIAWTYELIIEISKLRLLNKAECTNANYKTLEECTYYGYNWTPATITLIYRRITLLIGIVMVFFITFKFIKYLLEPDEVVDKEKGVEKTGFKLLTVVVLLAITPNIFDVAYKVQNSILDSQFLSQMVLGYKMENVETQGRDFSWRFLHNFYDVEPAAGYNCDGFRCGLFIDQTKNKFLDSGNLSGLMVGLDYKGEMTTSENGNECNDSSDDCYTVADFYIRFDYLLATLSGIVILWMLVMYTLDIGTRVIYMTFLQIIAPIPIISYLSPQKDGTFQKWVKACVTSYIDVFIRLGIIYFVMLLIAAINNGIDNGDLLAEISNSDLKVYIYIVLVLGVMRFGQKIPKLLEELFPKMGSAMGTFGLKPGERISTVARRAVGAAVGGAAGTVVGLGTGFAQGLRAGKRNGWAGFGRAIEGSVVGAIGGTTRGLYNGSKKGNVVKNVGAGIRNQTAANRRFGNRAESGYKWSDQIGDSMRQAFNTPTRVEQIEKQKAPLKAKKSAYENLAKANDAIREHGFKKAKDMGLASYVAYASAEGRLEKLQKDQSLVVTEKRRREKVEDGKVVKDKSGRIVYEDVDVRVRYGANSQKYKQAVAAAAQDMKKYKDAAINEYIDLKANRDSSGHIIADKHGQFYQDGRLDGLMKERDQNLTNYNKYASNDNKIPGEKEAIEITNENGTKEEKLIKDMTAWEYDEYIKKTANNEANDISRDISALDAKIQDIKDTTEGSGIPGGKK